MADALADYEAQAAAVLPTAVRISLPAAAYDAGPPIHALRLSCSAVAPAQIDAALNRLAAFIRDQLP
jgi:DNA-binding transcriptional MocR family regulator